MDKRTARHANTPRPTTSKPLGRLSPAASRLARRAGAYATLASVGPAAMGQRLRDGRMEAARRAVDPEGALTPDERERRAEAHVKAQRYRSLSHAQQVKAERSAANERREQRRARTPEARARAAAAETLRQERSTRTARQAAYWDAAATGEAADDGAAADSANDGRRGRGGVQA